MHVADQGGISRFASPDWVGTVSLVVEAALIVLGITMLMAYRQRSGQRLVVGGLGMIR